MMACVLFLWCNTLFENRDIVRENASESWFACTCCIVIEVSLEAEFHFPASVVFRKVCIVESITCPRALYASRLHRENAIVVLREK